MYSMNIYRLNNIVLVVFFNILIHASCTPSNNNLKNVSVEVRLEKDKQSLFFKVINNTDDIIYISKDYYITVLGKDSFALETYPKSNLINYNQFIAPDLRSVLQGDSLLGVIESSLLKDGVFFIRVFNSDPKAYFKNNATKVTEQEFILFEKEKSILVEGKLIQSHKAP